MFSKHSAFALVVFLAASFTAATVGGLATAESVKTWYPLLNKPDWNPPPWIFGPVWTALYVMMSIAAWRVYQKRNTQGANVTLALFFIQLCLNALWSILFFGLHSPGFALIEILILWGLLFNLQLRFWTLDRIAGWLWLPYLLWVTFASILNGTIWWLNR